MKYKILLSLVVLFISVLSFSQQKKITAYAITSEKQGQFVWTEVKLIDLTTGEVLQKIYENNKTDYQVFEAREGKPIAIKDSRGAITDNTKLPFSTFSAACAYDKKHNRLYYTPMYVNELRYIDLSAATPKIYYFSSESLSTATNLKDEANHITRMAIGADGSGYAISNDGNHFVKFTTGRKPTITDLGSLIDDASNGAVSVHNRCTSWGGDMVAAADGSLYLVSANRSAFKIDPSTRNAKYLGIIEGLPGNFTANGAVVADDGSLIVSSANNWEGYYQVDMKSWKATRVQTKGNVYNASDLANGNLAFTRERVTEPSPPLTRAVLVNNKISLYPNPVSEGVFRVSFDGNDLGRYEIQLVDITGRILLQKPVSIGNRGQVVEVELKNQVARGTYFVKVLNSQKKSMFADKIIID